MNRSFTPLGVARVGHHQHRVRSGFNVIRDLIEHFLGTDAAVEADGHGFGYVFGQGREKGFHGFAVTVHAGFRQNHAGQIGNTEFRHGAYGGAEIFPAVEGFEQNEIGAAVFQGLDGFAEGFDGLGDGNAAGAHGFSQRPHRPRHQHVVPGDLPGDPGGGHIDFPYLFAQQVTRQLETIGPEAVGGQYVRPGVTVGLMDFPDQIGTGAAEIFKADVDELVTVVQFGAHGSVENDHPFLQQFRQ